MDVDDPRPSAGTLRERRRAVWHGHAESDGFNALVLRAQLTWRQIVILRAIAKYLRQTRSAFSQSWRRGRPPAQLADRHAARRALRGASIPSGPTEARDAEQDRLAAQITEAPDDVAEPRRGPDHPRLLGVIRATLRTNYYQRDAAGQSKDYLSVKLDPSIVPDLPAPRPAFEIWVCQPARRGRSPALRSGRPRRPAVERPARGLPHRDPRSGQGPDGQERRHRPDRQQGRFYPKQLPEDAARKRERGIAAYRIFISGLLDLTDNRVGEDIVAPERTVPRRRRPLSRRRR